jgi:DNA repair exonuclease SbcCD ATPase subunit
MWKPQKIVIKGVGPYSNIDYLYNVGSIRFLQGINLDDVGQKNNGSGKSFIPECAFIALTGSCFRKLSLKELIKDGFEQGEIIFTLTNEFLKETLEITRIIKDSGQKCQIKNNDKIERAFTTGLEECAKYLFSKIEISNEDLMNFYIVQKDKYKSFFDCGDTEQKKIISRFSRSNVLNGIDKIIEKDTQIEKDKINSYQLEISNLTSKNEVYREEIDKIEKYNPDEEKRKDLKIEDDGIYQLNKDIQLEKNKLIPINNEIEELNQLVILTQREIISQKSLIDSFVFSIKQEDIDNVEKDKKQVEILITNIEKVKENNLKANREHSKELNEILLKLNDFIKCPKCNHEFSFKDSNEDVSLVRKKKIDLQLKIESITNEIKVIENDITLTDKNKKEFSEKILLLENNLKKEKADKNKLETNLTELETNLNNYYQKLNTKKLNSNNIELLIQSKNNQIEIHKQNIISIEKKKYNSDEDGKEKNEYLDKILANQKIIQENADIILDLQKTINTKIEWIELFKRFNTFLSNKAIKSIEGYTNFYLREFGTNLSVLIEGERTLANGKDTREEISVQVVRNGIIAANYQRFSSGEKVRTKLANIKAFQTLINLSTQNGGLDYLSLDEIIESLDNVGVNLLGQALKEIHSTIEIVTFTNNDIMNVDTLYCVKENDNTTIITQVEAKNRNLI